MGRPRYSARMHPHDILGAAGLALPTGADVEITGADPVIASKFRAGEAAAAALAACGAAASELGVLRGGARQRVTVDVRAAAASLLGFLFQRLDGDATLRTNEGNPSVALYECGDGRWIHLHGGFPHLRAGTLDVLGCGSDVAEITTACRKWDAQTLEDALAARGMCGAMVRTAAEWRAHAQGRALEPLPAVEVIRIGDVAPQSLPRGDRPLAGVRALDLTRILAGPACGRALAEHGADVLLVSSPKLPSIPPFVMDTGHGKRSAFLDLDEREDAATLRELIGGADVFAQGYRSGAPRLWPRRRRAAAPRHHLRLGQLLWPRGPVARSSRLGAARADRYGHRRRAGVTAAAAAHPRRRV